MVCAQVVGNDAAIAWGGASGSFELNVMLPVMGRNILESITLLANASRLLADRCVDGIEANVERIEQLVNQSLMLVTALNPKIGYDNAAKVAKKAHAEGLSLKEAAVALGLLTPEEVDELVAEIEQDRRRVPVLLLSSRQRGPRGGASSPRGALITRPTGTVFLWCSSIV